MKIEKNFKTFDKLPIKFNFKRFGEGGQRINDKKLIKITDSSDNIVTPGWLKLFKTKAGFEKYSIELEVLNENKVDYDLLDSIDISNLYPDLKGKFFKGISFRNSLKIFERTNSPSP